MRHPDCLRRDLCSHGERGCHYCPSRVQDNDGAVNVDAYYLDKIARKLIEPIDEVLTPTELGWVMSGRFHGDGRRGEAYVQGIAEREDDDEQS